MTLDEFLAVEVMGWKLKEEPFFTGWASDNGFFHFHVQQWSPTTDIKQAMMCLEQLGTWSIDGNREFIPAYDVYAGYYENHDGGHWRSTSSGESLPMAISLACARAKGWEE